MRRARPGHHLGRRMHRLGDGVLREGRPGSGSDRRSRPHCGNAEATFALIERIARREGWLGNLLAEGVKHAAAEVGQGSEKWAVHVKGMEQSAYDTRSATSTLLAYMTADVGAHHNRAWAITYDIAEGREKVSPDKAAKVIELQHIRPLMDVLGCCRLQWVELGMALDHYAPAMTALTGVAYAWEDLLHISERVWNLTRMIWVRDVEGFGRDWDAPAPRFVEEPATGGPTVAEMLTEVGIPPELVAGVIREGKLVAETYRPQDGEVIKLLMIMGGG